MSPIGKDGPRLEENLARRSARFMDLFGMGDSPRHFFAPGRVNLMGAHLDYNGGPVMPTAIDRGSFLSARPRADSTVNLASELDGRTWKLDLDDLPSVREGSWIDYPLGVIREIFEWSRGDRPGLDLLLGGNLPVGAGLSSSASVCVGTALVLDRIWDLSLEPMERVHAALHAEREFVGVQCGIMDPFAVGLARPGHLLWLDCRDVSYTHLPIDLQRLSLAVADTGVRRELAVSAFNERVRECGRAFEVLRTFQEDGTCLRDIRTETLEAHADQLDPAVRRRAEHVLGEVERTFSARQALLDGSPERFGAAMTAAHGSLRELYEVSVPELDQLVDDAISVEGVHGCRLTGAGFGGCVVALLERGAEEELLARLTEGFSRRFGREPAIEFFLGDEGPRELVGG
jgi:galactokinase